MRNGSEKTDANAFWMVRLGVSESGCGSFWKKQTGQEVFSAGCTVPAPASFGSDTDVFETEDLACGSGERTRFSVSMGDSTVDSYSLSSVDEAQDTVSRFFGFRLFWSDWSRKALLSVQGK
jgi:hypothetical protein